MFDRRAWGSVLLPALCGSSMVASAAAAPKLDKEDRAWLEQVKVLILPAEREVLEALRTREDRAEFRRIFWARRDPDLSTPENEFQAHFEAVRGEADERFHVGTVLRIPQSSDIADADRRLTDAQRREMIEYRQLRDSAERDALSGSQTDCALLLAVLGEPDDIRKKSMTVWGDRHPQVWVYSARGSQFHLDESCCLPPWAHGIRQGLAQSVVTQPGIAYHVEGGRITHKLESMLPRQSLAKALLREGRQDFALANQTGFLKMEDGSTAVVGLVRGDASGLAFQEEGGARKVRLDLHAELRRQGGGSVLVPDTEVMADLGDDGAFVASYRIGVRPGRYTLTVGVLEPLSGKGSVVTEPLDAPDYDVGELTLGSVFPLADVRPAAEDPLHPLSAFVMGDSLLVPRFGNVFHPSEALLISYQFYDAEPDASQKRRSTAQLSILDAAGAVVAQGPPEEFDTPVAGSVLGPIPLARYAPGRYTIRLSVTDHVAGRFATRESAFEVGTDPPAGRAIEP